MKRSSKSASLASLIAATVLTAATITAHGQALPPGEPAFVPDEVLVQFRTSASEAQLANALQRGALSVKKHIPVAGKPHGDSGLVLLKTQLPLPQALAALENHPAVLYAVPNTIRRLQASSNDPNYVSGKLWGMYGDQTTPANKYGCQAGEAWVAGNIGSSDVHVVVLDQGIDISHPDLAANIGRNPGETGLDALGHDKATNGVDDDGNGYVDDVYGYDFMNNDNTVFDSSTDDDHGTHVAGTIGAVGGNGLGVVGVCWKVNLFSGKFMGANGGTVADEVEAIEYFIDLKQRHGLNIIAFNASYGGGKNLAEQIALIHAAKAGILVCAAAGNAGMDYPTYPASFDTSKDALNSDGSIAETHADYDAIIAVASITSKGALARNSNYGSVRVDLGAPGDGILSTLSGGRYGTMSGTSMAAPHVTGGCALYLSSHSGAFPWDIKAAILSSTIPTTSLAGKTVTGGRLNVSGF